MELKDYMALPKEERMKIISEAEHDDYDPTPWCHQCGAMTKAKCDCGPIADNN
jgi:hypothetical protein